MNASRPTGSCATRSSSRSAGSNGDYSTLGHQAVAYLHHGYPREEMVALYLAADVMLVTALRDGMNLVAKEYVACRFDADGVLLLSEFTGASDELRQAVLVNPHDIEGLKDAIVESIQMPKRERSRRMRALRRRVRENDVAKWSATFLETLTGAGIIAPGVSDPLQAAISTLAAPSACSSRSTSTARSRRSSTGRRMPAPPIARAPRSSASRSPTTPASRIVSGRALASLDEVASPPDGTLLSGSHGVELQLDPAGVTIDLRDSEMAKLERLSSIVEEVAATADGAWIERKPAGLALHTRRLEHDRRHGAAALGPRQGRGRAPRHHGAHRARQCSSSPCARATRGSRWPACASTSGATATIYVGDDVTDEDAFAALDGDDVGVKVGQGKSIATYRVRSPEDVAELLERLADARDAAREGASPWT